MFALRQCLRTLSDKRILQLKSPIHFFKNVQNFKIVPIKKPNLPDDYEERNVKLARPISPHLTIYKFEMPALQSILHRTSGILLSTYVLTFSFGTLLLSHDFKYYVDAVHDLELNSWLINTGKFLFVFPFVFHFLGGVKHLIWDFGKFLEMKHVYTAGYIIFIGSIILSIFLTKL